MPRFSKVFRVLIASPSDVLKEREIALKAVYGWNAANSVSSGIILEPVGWENNVYPEFDASGPQQVINNQIVENSDLLIGIFWSRIGTPTETFLSGSIEELSHFIENNKPVMIYFSERPIPPNNLDSNQYEKLKSFKKSCMQKGIVSIYSEKDQLYQELLKSFDLLISKLTEDENSNLRALLGQVDDKFYKLMKGDDRITFNFSIDKKDKVEFHLAIYKPISDKKNNPFGTWEIIHDIDLTESSESLTIKKKEIYKLIENPAHCFKFYLKVPRREQTIKKYYYKLLKSGVTITGRGSKDPDNHDVWRIWFLHSDEPVHPLIKEPWRFSHSLIKLPVL